MMGVIVEGGLDPAPNLALDEALVRVDQDGPLLRLWQTAPCVIGGRFQPLGEGVDLVACARDGVPLVRRASGGTAVYADPGSLNLTLVTARASRPFSLETVVASALAALGLPAEARSGEVTLDGATLCRTSTVWTYGVLLATLTLHVSTPQWLARTYVPDDGAPAGSLIEAGLRVGVTGVRNRLLATATALAGQVHTRPPSRREAHWRDRLMLLRYGDPGWHLVGDLRADADGTWMPGTSPGRDAR
ncbi:MAG: lipoate--protein ligase family protein [Streptosporangiales bacterium]|nr:lipoate--protein ligase family protein [Streptosporangiales bacterium]